MNERDEFKPSIARLRLKVATNLFKGRLLGDLHILPNAQTSAVFDALTKQLGECLLTERTWQAWFSNTHRVPKIDKIKHLDTLLISMNEREEDESTEERLPAGICSNLVHGGLVHTMLAPSKSKHALDMLIARADKYQPLTAISLHLDAVEIAAMSDGFGNVPWTKVKAIAAYRILTILTDRWGPRHGSIFSTLTSDLRLRWDAADNEERSKIRDSYARFKPDLFDATLNAKASPHWSKAGIEDDVSTPHVYKMLFSLAADTEFLVADRLKVWTIDLATAALAMHALAWSDRYVTFGSRITDELIFWSAFDEILFGSELLDTNHSELVAAKKRCKADWSLASFETFTLAREFYQSTLIKLGISTDEVMSVAMRATKTHPLRYSA